MIWKMIGLDLDLRVVKKVLNFLIIFCLFERFGNNDIVLHVEAILAAVKMKSRWCMVVIMRRGG
jgi:hypothetical protein